MNDRERRPDIFVVGAGGIGCAVGYALLEDAIPVRFVETDERKLAAGRRDGVSVDDRPPLAAEFVRFKDWRPPQEALILLCTKCFDNAAVLARLPSSAVVMPIQNGFDPALMRRSAIEGVSSFVSECPADRPRTRITREGELHVGRSGAGSSQAPPSALAAVIDAWTRKGRFRVKRVADILPYKYAKLMYNAAISPIAAATGLDNSRLLTIPELRALFFAMLRENHRILKDAGIALGKVGPFHPDTVDKILRLPLLARLMSGPFARSLRNTYCSMSGDIELGRTEIDYFNGHLLALAGSGKAPLNRALRDLVKRMEAERAQPAPERLQEVLDARACAAEERA